MTNAEYSAFYKSAAETFHSISFSTLKALHGVYVSAGEDVAKRVREATLSGKSEITIESRTIIEAELQRGAATIASALEEQTPDLVQKGYEAIYQIDEDYLMSALKEAGVTRIAVGDLQAYGSAVNHRLVTSMVNRVWQDGYTFSERVWGPANAYQDAIKNLIAGGLAQGRDPAKIASDVTAYLRDGLDVIPGRWGDLEPGTREYLRRIPKNVDYRAVTLVRSELYASLQEAGREEGFVNPAAIGMYNWVLEPGSRPADDPCPEIADNSPYTLEALPGYPHPRCRCHVYPILRDRREFLSDLKTWANGEPVDYLDEWEARMKIAPLTV